jgi:hypothetical protein
MGIAKYPQTMLSHFSYDLNVMNNRCVQSPAVIQMTKLQQQAKPYSRPFLFTGQWYPPKAMT